ncbi:MAG TPA: PKD domain-containing protein, partial [Candidatus Saccharimonadales bacterium]|nr:PKD domain-containing protein [Candidatus Saccharimonadales bacterium]
MCKDSITKSIQVLPQPAAAFTGTNTTACKPPLTTSFSSNVAGATSYQWFFGDGGTASGAQPSHTYTTSGSYDVTLIVTNAAGCTDTLLKPGFVRILPPAISIANTPAEGCVPLTYQPVVNIQSVDPITSWSWDFGDGFTSTAALPVHTYTNPGTYTLKVIFTTSGGCTDSLTIVNAVRVGIRLQPNFSATPRDACAFQPIRFSDLTLGGNADSWFWQFGDGGTSIDQNPIYLYQDTGYFPITLTVTNNGCRDSFRIDRYIHIKPPIARFIDSSGCSDPFTRKFIDQSIGATSWYWEFGDGNTSTQRSPTHSYAAPGLYTVQLVVRNDTCEHLTLRQVYIISEVPDFTASDTVVCKGEVINFQTRNVNTANISSYTWNFGDGIVQVAGNEVNHIYRRSGTFTVQLTMRDINGCTSSLAKPLYIRVNGPTANFNSSVPGACLQQAVEFNDLSSTDGTHGITSWIWHYGDGATDTLTAPPFQHTYVNPGRYTVKLIAIDDAGCTDSISKGNSIVISKPQANFSSPDTVTCVDKPVRFSNLSSGPSLTYRWEFGDAQQSVAGNPVHNY